MPKSGWSKEDVPSQVGKLAVITGTGGLGYETALVLAEKGATIILAGRNAAKGQESVDKIKSIVPDAKISFEQVDLGSLESIAEFGRRFNGQHQVLDILINNAGVMMPAKRETTKDGFELQMGTNHFGHFALTSHLLPALRRSTSGPRVVTVSSGAHKMGKMNFDDLQWERSYDHWGSYGQSKLANLLFMHELQKKSDEGGWGLMSNASHPGFARTDLVSNMEQTGNGFKSRMMEFMKPFMSQSAADGALPTLYGATAPEAKGRAFYGPGGCLEMKGAPKEVDSSSAAKEDEAAKKLWDVSNTLTGVTWP